MSNSVFEYVSRRGRKMSQDGFCENKPECTCLVIVAILKRPLMLDCLLLIKQYRKNLNNFTLEFPVAVVDDNENDSEAAVKEIEDLTGYKGTVQSVGEVSAFDAGISNYTTRLIVVQINGGDVPNANIRFHPNPPNENTQGVEVIALPMSDLNNRLSCFVKDGFVVDSRVEMYAVGLKTNASHTTPTMVY